MLAVKIHCLLGLNLFFIPQFTIENAPTLALELNPSVIVKCAMVFVTPLATGERRNGGGF
jgi:hypothetical protein